MRLQACAGGLDTRSRRLYAVVPPYSMVEHHLTGGVAR
jgi:hypothetical protein